MSFEQIQLMAHVRLARSLMGYGKSKVDAVCSVIRTYELTRNESMALIKAVRLDHYLTK